MQFRYCSMMLRSSRIVPWTARIVPWTIFFLMRTELFAAWSGFGAIGLDLFVHNLNLFLINI